MNKMTFIKNVYSLIEGLFIVSFTYLYDCWWYNTCDYYEIKNRQMGRRA